MIAAFVCELAMLFSACLSKVSKNQKGRNIKLEYKNMVRFSAEHLGWIPDIQHINVNVCFYILKTANIIAKIIIEKK